MWSLEPTEDSPSVFGNHKTVGSLHNWFKCCARLIGLHSFQIASDCLTGLERWRHQKFKHVLCWTEECLSDIKHFFGFFWGVLLSVCKRTK